MKTRCRVPLVCSLLVLGAVAVASVPAFALDPYDAPVISCVSAGENQITIKICGGATTGAPAGITLQWKTVDQFNLSGWDDVGLCKLSLSGQPSLQHPDKSRWELLAGECSAVIIGDINFDETGVSGEGCGLDPLECGTDYVFRAFAHAGRRMGRSDWTADLTCSTLPCPPGDCTFTQGYWKTHGPAGCNPSGGPNVWPVSSLHLGVCPFPNPTCPGGDYTAAQLCSILNTPAAGNCLISLAHQLIAAKLNVANGATCPAILTLIAAVDAHIGNRRIPPVGAGTMACNAQANNETMKLDQFNNGIMPDCPVHCDGSANGTSQAARGEKAPWGTIKVRYR